jgi:hypothetical protein
MEGTREAATVLAYVRAGDWDLARVRLSPTPLLPDGYLELRRPAAREDRLVLPRVFLGRQRDGRLAFRCAVVQEPA